LSDKRAMHLMTHRGEVEWLDLNKSVQEIKGAIMNSMHSKLLCCRGSLDRYEGFLYLKDYFKAVISENEVNLQELLIQPFVATANTSAQDILEAFKNEKIYFCIVVDKK